MIHCYTQAESYLVMLQQQYMAFSYQHGSINQLLLTMILSNAYISLYQRINHGYLSGEDGNT